MFTLLTLATKSNWDGDADKVTAGWIGALVLGLLIVATVLLLWSFTRQLKKVRSADAAGVYGTDEDTSTDDQA
ncbi:hypothetical protein [Nocardioides jejuensis]|uniref:Uncharacterized protein n=1 Tax=Nocardioides jejuensis TaxID=2502782 RepID=A0A4R1C311_9ACTN|nr:hypothetical protein [Nocardioides jejuensis]TCJ24156.1 hypothetical protein EPD65_09685 [Nocardioides jejuensis]